MALPTFLIIYCVMLKSSMQTRRQRVDVSEAGTAARIKSTVCPAYSVRSSVSFGLWNALFVFDAPASANLKVDPDAVESLF